MNSIIYVGMDVHTSNFTLAAYSPETQNFFAESVINPDIDLLMNYFNTLKRELGDANDGEVKIVCGYEAGGLGYTLQRELTRREIECIILAPSTMSVSAIDKVKKNDKIDARKIAKCLAFNTYRKVYVPQENDEAVKEYIRMRDDIKLMEKQTKQQIVALCTRFNKQYSGTKKKWTKTHRKWLADLSFSNPIIKEALDEYLLHLSELEEKVERCDRKIEELSQSAAYASTVKKITCFKGIAVHTAMAFVVEVGDFKRFPTAQHFASYLGLTPSEHSSGNKKACYGITKAGNSHLRRLLVEAAQCFNRGAAGSKSAALKKRQEGCTPEEIRYADRANERLRKKYARIASHSHVNVAKTAIARELACFIWGMMVRKTV